MGKIILGIDPGLNFIGFCILENKHKLIEYGEIKVKKSEKFKLKYIYLKIEEIIKKYKPDCISIETTYINKNFHTSLILKQAQSIPVILGELYEIPIILGTPLQVRKSVMGKGVLEKQEVKDFIFTIFKLEENKNMTTNVCDAILMSLYGFNQSFLNNS